MKSSIFAHAVLFTAALCVLLIGIVAAEDDVSPEDAFPQIDTSVVIADVNYADEDEWVEIANPGRAIQDFTYWTLKDQENNTYLFPTGFVLYPETSAKVHSGMGVDTENDLYWGLQQTIWEDGDVLTLVDTSGEVVSQHPNDSV